MTEKLKQTIKESVELLPKELKESINVSDWEKISEEIAKRHFLSEDETTKLQAEIAIVFLGLGDKNSLRINIEYNIGMSEEEAQKITMEVEEKILNRIFNEMSQKIKLSLKNKTTHWQQNLDFILSGGDYSFFVKEPMKINENKIPEPNSYLNPSKVDDLKSKFTI